MELREYVAADGKSPFARWLRDLRDREGRARILARLARVRLGNLGDTRSVGDGVHEMRLTVGPGYRVYFGREDDALIVLLCGGEKNSQERDIKLAKRFWRDYLERRDGN